MTAQRDPDSLIQAFLEEGPTELADRSYDAVRSEIDQTHQRVVIGPWRVPNMSNFARFAIAAVAVVAVVAVGIYLLPGQGGIGGPGPTATPTPTASPSPTPSPAITATKLPSSGALAPGTYYIDDAIYTQAARLVFTVPAGWTGEENVIHKHKDRPGALRLEPWQVSHVYGDVCQWRETLVPVGTTVDELISALEVQTGRNASAPTDVTLGGFPAKRIELITPELEVAFCHGAFLRYWPDPGPNENGGLGSSLGNHTDLVYAVDVSGKPWVVVARYYADSSAQDVAELDAIVESIQIEP